MSDHGASLHQAAENALAAEPFDTTELMYDIVFVLNANSKGWILEKICRVIADRSGLHCEFVYSERNDHITARLPRARNYFFAHYSLAFWALVREPLFHRARCFVWYTHPDPNKGVSLEELANVLQYCRHVFCTNSAFAAALHRAGMARDRMSVPIGGVDTAMFPPTPRGSGIVGLSGAFYARKQPEKMHAMIAAMPETRFRLIAPGPADVENQGMLWYNYPDFVGLLALPNFEYVEARYEDYPALYADLDVFVSLSSLEGGPIAVIEALASDLVPVVTRTGFAEEVIRHGENGFLIDVDASVEAVCEHVRRALRFDRPVWQSALDYEWTAFADQILEAMAVRLHPGVRMGMGPREDGATLIETGFAAVRPHGIVTTANHSQLRLPCVFGRAGTHVLTLDLLVDQHSSAGCHLTLTLAGRPLMAERWLEPGSRRITLPFWVEEDDDPLDYVLAFDTVTDSPFETSARLTIDGIRVDEATPDALPRAIAFGGTRDGGPWLIDGWHDLEEAGVWSAAPVATLGLPIAAGDRGGAVRIEVSGWIFATDDVDPGVTSLRARWGDSEVVAVATHQGIMVAAAIEIAPSGARADTIELSIERSVLHAPAGLIEDHIDVRRLGFWLDRIAVVPAGPAGAGAGAGADAGATGAEPAWSEPL